jgi:hypothetical protein
MCKTSQLKERKADLEKLLIGLQTELNYFIMRRLDLDIRENSARLAQMAELILTYGRRIDEITYEMRQLMNQPDL